MGICIGHAKFPGEEESERGKAYFLALLDVVEVDAVVIAGSGQEVLFFGLRGNDWKEKDEEETLWRIGQGRFAGSGKGTGREGEEGEQIDR